MIIDLLIYNFNFRIIKIISSLLPAWLDEYLHEYVQDHLRYRPICPPYAIRDRLRYRLRECHVSKLVCQLLVRQIK